MHDWAIDDESAGAIGATTGAGQPATLNESQNLELFGKASIEAVVDRLLGPFADIQIPKRAVVGSKCGDATENIQR